VPLGPWWALEQLQGGDPSSLSVHGQETPPAATLYTCSRSWCVASCVDPLDDEQLLWWLWTRLMIRSVGAAPKQVPSPSSSVDTDTSGPQWIPLHVIGGGASASDGLLMRPLGLRFAPHNEGAYLVVCDSGNNRLSRFSTRDGSFLGHVTTGLECPVDVEPCQDGWLVVSNIADCIYVVADGVGDEGGGCCNTSDGNCPGGGACGGSASVRGVSSGTVVHSMERAGEGGEALCSPSGLALVPGLGLVVRQAGNAGCLFLLAAHDDIAMAAMSGHRMGWMVGVARASMACVSP
jgi:hypothetical protein